MKCTVVMSHDLNVHTRQKQLSGKGKNCEQSRDGNLAINNQGPIQDSGWLLYRFGGTTKSNWHQIRVRENNSSLSFLVFHSHSNVVIQRKTYAQCL